MAKKRRKLGEILFKAGLVKKEPLINAIKTAKTNHKKLGEVLIESGLINQDTLTKVIAKQFGLEYVNLDKVTISDDVTELVPEEIIKKHNILPLAKNNGQLKLAISDPLNLDTMDAVRFRLNIEPVFCIANPDKIQSYIKDIFDKIEDA